MKNLLLVFIFALSCSYMLFAGMFFLLPLEPEFEDLDKMGLFFTNSYGYFSALSTMALSGMGFGRCLKKEEMARHYNQMSRELEDQKQRLIDYMQLAKIITKEDTKDIIERYVAKIDKKYMEGKKNGKG